jgi:hypothetical protein
VRLRTLPLSRKTTSTTRGRRACTAYRAECLLRVKLRRTQCEQMSSELPLRADIAQYSPHVSKMPRADVNQHRAVADHYSALLPRQASAVESHQPSPANQQLSSGGPSSRSERTRSQSFENASVKRRPASPS